jgi:integral membrane protein (TIGR00529 family)
MVRKDRMAGTLKVILALAVIIVLIRFRVRLSITLLGASIALGLLFHLTPTQIAQGFYAGALDPETLKLIAAMLLVLFFSAVMKETGSMSRSISSLRAVFRDARVSMGLIPAIIGLLPVTGGAILSAPLVAEASDDLGLSPEKRTFLNFWFRHVWEYTLPTFPFILLTSVIVGMPVADLCLVNLPLTIASIAGGIFFGFRGIKSHIPSQGPLNSVQIFKKISSFFINLLPFFLVIFLTLFYKIHLAYSISLITAGMILTYRIPLPVLHKLGKTSLSLEIVVLLLAIMIFKQTLVASGAMHSMAGELAQIGMPPVFLVILLPALIGFITGYSPALGGLSLPVLLPFIQSSSVGTFYVMLAVASGLSAHLLSPMHACLVMTLEYYKANIEKTYRLLFAPVAVIFLTGVIVFLLAYGFRQ